jgi:eukaryotic-like serine/threonine-protein kinase
MKMDKFIKITVYVFAFILLGLAFGFLTFKLLSFSRTVQMPELNGKSLVEANRLLTDIGLYIKIEGEDYDAAIPQGNIIKQDIPAGNNVKERRSIKVVISKGPRVRSVPMLVNDSITNAETALLQKGLKIGKVIMVHSDLVEKDRIISQKPEPDEQVSDVVTVLVSQGPYDRTYLCPDFTDMPLEQASILIKKLNLKSVTEGSGEIIGAQRPDPGRQIKAGDTIYLKLY